MQEIWIEIAGTNGRYSVSNTGNIRANWSDIPSRILPHRKRVEKSYLLKPCLNSNGYFRVSLGRNKKKYVHRLVAEAFVENPNLLSQVDHIDGNRENNHFSNLRWVTPAENCAFGGERHNWTHQREGAKKNRKHDKMADEYKRLLKSGLSLRKIAKIYGTSHSSISRALMSYDL